MQLMESISVMFIVTNIFQSQLIFNHSLINSIFLFAKMEQWGVKVNSYKILEKLAENMYSNFSHALSKIMAAIWLKILIAINHAIIIFNCDYSHQNKKHKFVAQNNSTIHDITSIARCKRQQNVLQTTEIKIKTFN